MSKQSGLGMSLFVGGYDLSGDIQSLGKIGGGPSPLDVTGINALAVERIGGKRDGAIEMTSFFNPSSSHSHPVLSALPTSQVHVMAALSSTRGDPAASEISRQVNYDGSVGADGGFTFSVSAQSDGTGVEWGRLLTAGAQTDTTAGSSTSVDFTDVSTSFGWQSYLQVLSVTGTSVTVTLEDSASAASGFATLTGGAFTAVASPGPSAQRLTGSRTATVRRYVRITTSGTFTEAIFVVSFVRNLTDVVL